MNNWFRTTLLMAALTGLFVGCGYLIGGGTGMVIAFLLAAAMNFFAYWNADRMVLSMYGAREIGRDDAPELHRLLADLARNGAIPTPRLYIIDNPQPNAFATGRNPQNAAVAVTTGIMQILTREELAGVIAHELAHIKNRDTLTMTITATVAGAIGMLANFAFFLPFGSSNDRDNPLGGIGGLVVALLAPIGAMLVQMAISRTREYEADRVGAEICGRPIWLAHALEKIDAYARGTLNLQAERNPATAHMFIINPLHGHGADNLFSTHPNTPNRIARLEAMGSPSGDIDQRPQYAGPPAGWHDRSERAPARGGSSVIPDTPFDRR